MASITIPTSETQPASASTPLANALAVLLPCTFLLTSVTGASFAVLGAFAMVPVNTFMRHSYLWNIFTHPVVETNVLLLATNLVVIISALRPLEKEVGRAKLLQLFVFCSVAVSGALLLLTPALSALFNAPFASAGFCGFAPLAIATLIASWQRFGDQPIAALGDSLALRSRHLPSLAFLFYAIVDLTTGPGIPADEEISAGIVPVGPYSVAAAVGLQSAWFFLRFIAVANGQQQGDLSAAFAFHEMFPGPFRILAKAVGQVFWPVVKCCGYGAGVQSTPSPIGVTESVPVVANKVPNSVADRRRQLALAALSQRLERARQLESDSAIGATPAEALPSEKTTAAALP